MIYLLLLIQFTPNIPPAIELIKYVAIFTKNNGLISTLIIKLTNKAIDKINNDENKPSINPFLLATIPLINPNIKNNIIPTTNVILVKAGVEVDNIPLLNRIA